MPDAEPTEGSLQCPMLSLSNQKPRTLAVLSNHFSSVQFSRSVVSDSLRPHESQDARPPCPSPTPRVHSDSHPLSQWRHPAISSSVIPFSSCPQSLPTSESFPMSQLFPWGGQSTGVSALASFLPKKSQGSSYFSLIQNPIKKICSVHSPEYVFSIPRLQHTGSPLRCLCW